jgi:hypothetical protein
MVQPTDGVNEMEPDVFGNTLLIVGICFSVLMTVLYIWSLVWVYQDSQKRGKTGCLWLLIVFFTWPFGLIAYFLLRDQEVIL